MSKGYGSGLPTGQVTAADSATPGRIPGRSQESHRNEGTRVAARRKEYLAGIKQEGAALKPLRILAIRKRIGQINRILGKRAGKPERGGVSWDESGFMVRRERALNLGAQVYERIEEYRFDTPIFEALEHDIALETGDRHQVVEHPDEGKGLSEIARALTECFSVEKIDELITAAEAAAPQQ